MLWSLTKVLVFVAMVAAVAVGAGLLMETDGGITVAFGGIEFTLSPLFTAIGLIVLIFAVWVFLKVFSLFIAILKFINGDETAFSRFFDKSRERRGIDALADGLVALASGDGDLAMAKAQKADRLLNKPEVTNLIMAQAAEKAGDRRVAENTFKKLLDFKKTRFVAVRGLLKQKLEDGDTETALKLAEKAFDIQPKHEENQDTLLKLQTAEEDWSGARSTLAAKLKHGILPRDVHRRRDAVMAVSEARKLRQLGQVDDAQSLIIEANRLSPDLVAAATMTAKGYMDQGKPNMAARVIKAAWQQSQHPDLAAAYAALMPDETPEERVKRFKNLIRGTTKLNESKMVMAELHLANEDAASARTALGKIAEEDPTVRSLSILAAIEKMEAAPEEVVNGLLTKALTAQRDPEWVCGNCGEIHSDWDAICDHCGAFDTITWKRPSATVATLAPSMMPLLSNPTAPKVIEVEDMEIIDTPSEIEVIEDGESAEKQA
ncbi:MAG: heme biosynthesis HemY N-terminal domain-containing protein [Planktomarina sp.]